MVRILIADTQEFARSRLRKLIEAQAGWELVAEAGDGKDAISKAADIKPDVAVLAYSLPVINGIEAAREIRVRVPDTAVLISMLRDDEVLPEDVLRAGAREYILKTASQRELLQAIVAVGIVKQLYPEEFSEIALGDSTAQATPKGRPLSGRETTVVKLVAEGHTNRQIAQILHISLKTVETYRATAMRKLHLSSAAHLVRYAVRYGLIEP